MSINRGKKGKMKGRRIKIKKIKKKPCKRDFLNGYRNVL
jgi:hypothetical protein